MKYFKNVCIATLIACAFSSNAISQDNIGEEEVAERKLFLDFVERLLAFYSDEYRVIPKASSGDNLMDYLQRNIKSKRSSGDVKIDIHYLRGRRGRHVRDYEGKIFNRINITIISVKDTIIANSLVNVQLRMMSLYPPLKKPLPKGVHWPPVIIIKGLTNLVFVKTRCEDLLMEDGSSDDESYWQQAEEIVRLIKGFKPKLILVNGCGGPLRDMTDFVGKKSTEEK